MEYLGHTKGVDFMQAGDTIFAFVFGRWVRYCGMFDWFETIPGRILRKLNFNGFTVRVSLT